MKIKQINVNDLIPYANNARTHSDEQIFQIGDSIKEFGFNNPVLLDGAKGVIAGHGRLMAAKKLGIEMVPCIELSHLSETQKKAYILADNKLALNAGWDDGLLMGEIKDLMDLNFDIEITGFEVDEFDPIEFDKGKAGIGKIKTNRTVKMAIFCEDIKIVEAALAETGEINRGEALAIICGDYLAKR